MENLQVPAFVIGKEAKAFLEFLKKKSQNEKCPICESNRWHIEGGADCDSLSLVLYRKIKNGSASYGVPCYGMICLECGYIQLFARGVLKNILPAIEQELENKEQPNVKE